MEKSTYTVTESMEIYDGIFVDKEVTRLKEHECLDEHENEFYRCLI
jgi:hypothetical protein